MLSAIREWNHCPYQSKFISYINECVNSPDNNNQVTILYGLEMTKTVLFLTIFVFGANTNPNRL